jgi:hypothetical protein
MSDRQAQSLDKSFDLTIRDRLNFPFLLGEQVTTFQKAILNKDYSRREIEEAIKGLQNLIPSRWEDEQFKNDLAKAKTTIKLDIRPRFAGVSMDRKLCEEQGIPIEQEIEVLDYFPVLKACIDLLDRLGMLSKREHTESVTGMPFGEIPLPEGMNRQEYLASLEEDPGDDAEDPYITGG